MPHLASAPSPAAPASSAAASFTAAVATTSGPASPATTTSAASPAPARHGHRAAIAADGTWTGNRAASSTARRSLNFPVFIHKIHMGNKLALTGRHLRRRSRSPTRPPTRRTSATAPSATAAPAPHGRQLEDPAPSRRACGACHDDSELREPARRRDGPCTRGGAAGDRRRLQPPATSRRRRRRHRRQAHARSRPPNPHNIYANPTRGNANTNAAYVAAAGSVPPGAKVITYEVQSVSRWTDAAAGRSCCAPQIAFKLQPDGADAGRSPIPARPPS